MYSSSLTCRIFYPGLSHFSSGRLLTLRRGNCSPSMPLSVPFIQSPLDVILATTKRKEMHGKVFFFFITQPERNLSKAIFLSCICLARICPRNSYFRCTTIELLLCVTVWAILSRWLVSLEIISNTTDNWERETQWLHPWVGEQGSATLAVYSNSVVFVTIRKQFGESEVKQPIQGKIKLQLIQPSGNWPLKKCSWYVILSQSRLWFYSIHSLFKFQC